VTETKPYQLTQSIYTKLILEQRLKRSRLIYILCICLGVFLLVVKSDFGPRGLFPFLLIGYPIFSMVYLYFWSRSKKLAPIFEPTQLSFDSKFIYVERNGSESKIPYKNITNVKAEKEYFLLYVSSGMFIYVLKDIFYSEEDRHTFKTYINA
jgi:hypothetical protein